MKRNVVKIENKTPYEIKVFIDNTEVKGLTDVKTECRLHSQVKFTIEFYGYLNEFDEKPIQRPATNTSILS